MNSCVTVQDIATAAGVNRSTVSRVLSGKAAQGRISPDTQNRIRAIANQLGYRPGAFVRYHATKPTPGNLSEKPLTAGKAERQMGLILTPNSPASSLAFIPEVVPPIAAAGYELVIVTLPADPTAARERILQLINEGVAGLFCCPTVYAAVLEFAGSSTAGAPNNPPTRIPVIVLWQGAGKAMMKSVGSVQVAVGSGVPSEAKAVPVATLPPKPVGITPVVTRTPPPVTPVARPEPAIVVPIPAIMPKPQPDPVPVSAPVILETPAVTPEPVFVAPSTPTPSPEPVLEPEPIATPEPEIEETPTPALDAEPDSLPQPAPIPVSAPVILEPPVVAIETPVEPMPTPSAPEPAPQVFIPATPTPPLIETSLPPETPEPEEETPQQVPSTDSESAIPTTDSPAMEGDQLVFYFHSIKSPRNWC